MGTNTIRDGENDKVNSGKKNLAVDIDIVETQAFDSQFSPSSSPGREFKDEDLDEMQFLQCTVPFDDTIPIEDNFETQVVNIAGETQEVYLVGETQVLDDLYSVENNGTQWLDDFDTEIAIDGDDEGTETTEVLDDVEEQQMINDDLHGQGNGRFEEESSSLNKKENSSGSTGKGLFSIRVASIRACGLAARNKSLKENKETNSNPCLNTTEQHPLAVNYTPPTRFGEYIDKEHTIVDYDEQMNGSPSENRCRVGSSTVRKLFTENTGSEFKANGGAGLSYVDSQEPGEFSQANALEFVDKFLNIMEINDESDFVKSRSGKSKVVSSAEGTRNLAKRVNSGIWVREIGAYDWDDSREDEGGGEFLIKHKEAFFDNLGHKSKVELKKNDCPDIGPDTQMAAEAMEAMAHQGTKNSRNGDVKRTPNKRMRSSRNCQKGMVSSISSVITRQSKQRKTDTNLGKDHFTPNKTKNLQKPSSKITGKKNGKVASEKSGIGEIDRDNLTSSTDRISIKKRCLQNEIITSTPIARRTRRCMEPTDSKRDENGSNDSIEEKNTRGRRTRQTLSSTRKEANLSLKNDSHTSSDPIVKRKVRSSLCGARVSSSLARQNGERLLQKRVDNEILGITTLENGAKSSKDVQATAVSKVSPREKSKLSSPSCTTPVNRATPVNEASPICMGDEYFKQSCRKNLSRSCLMKEISSLISTGPEPSYTVKDSRRRRDIASVRALFSRHLDGDIIKDQKKILVRLGASVASSMSDATHFITDEFVRTRNMLEAIASGKPVVTQLWLESCGQANCLIDEKNYILRDAKKEKEFGFSMPVSLARADQRPLLRGLRVLITPNTKPGKEILASLVKAVHGLAVERIGRSAMKDDKLPDDLLVLSCEEDYSTCLPFLEKGASVYSSELLLNGIVIQKLEYERHRLFADHIKRTRSTIWLKKNNQYLPVTECK